MTKPTPPKNEVFLIVDALALIHRAFHAVPPLSTKDGRVVNAVFGFLTILIKAMKDTHPEYVAVAFDRKEPTFRHEAFKEYKAHREKKPDDLYAQIPIVENVLKTLRIPTLSVCGYEADDIIATLCTKTEKNKGLERVILTGDKDTLQLVDDGTSVLTPGKGIKDTLLYTPARVRERFGLEPEQMIDFKALRGDPSDNIPGVRGIGEIGAAKLLQDFGTLEKLYSELEKGSPASEKISARHKAALVEFKADALKAKHLVALVHDVKLDFDLQEARLREPDRASVIAALSELEFKSLVPRVLEAFPGGPDAGTPSTSSFSKKGKGFSPSLGTREGREGSFSVADNDSAVSELVKLLKEQEKVALVPFFSGSFLDGKLETVAFAWENSVRLMPAKREFLEKTAAWLASDETEKICHDSKSCIGIFGTLGMEIRGISFDTMLASYVLSPGSRAHEIEALAFSELGREMPKVQISLLPAPSDGYERDAASVKAVWDLAPKLALSLKKENLSHILEKFDLPLSPVLSAMERHGVELDVKFLGKLSASLGSRLAELDAQIKGYAGAEVNVNSPQQLAEVLFEKLQIQKSARVRRTAGGKRYSTAAEELEKLKDSHPIVPLILEHRELAKLLTTYVDALPHLVRKDTGRVHTTFNQTVTATGRLSSSDPNLQNIPIRTELGRETRKAFVAPAGSSLIVADYSQIELRILAHLSEDPALIEAFRMGQDIHRRTASEVWGIPLEEVTKQQRSAAKAINFGIAYGMGANALAESAGIPVSEARDFIDKYFLTFRKVGEYLENAKELAYAQGYAETLFGRRRYLPELKSNIPYLRAAGERMAVNAPIQGANADAIKLAMIELHRLIAGRWGVGRDAGVKMLIQVHDELVFEAKKGLEAEAVRMIREKLEGAISLRVPVKVDVRIGKSWGELENFEDAHED